MHTHELLDRFELLYADEKPVLADLRRAIIDDDLSSIFRVADAIAIQHENINDFRKAVMEKNLHAMFRTLKTFTNNENEPIEDLRKAITEQNHRSIFRVFDNFESNDQLDDLRKAITEKNHRSIFRVLEGYGETGLDDLRKIAGEDLNLHSLFRLLPGFVKKAPLEDLRKAIVEDNLHALFRLLEHYELDVPFEDLRKAIVEDNLHALFRLLEHYELDVPLEDLRKAIVEENIYSIFRILEEYQKQELVPLSIPLEDLRKSITEENIHSIFRVLPRIDPENRTLSLIRKFVINKGEDVDAHIRLKNTFDVIGLFVDSVLLDTLWRVINSFPNANIKDAYSRGQILSKKWLIKELENLPIDLGTVFLCAGWYGTLALMLFESGMKITKIRSFDIDDEVWPIAETINRPMVMSEWQFKAQTEDICKINYKDGHTYNTYRRDGQVRELYDKPDTVINTSCEHIENFREWYDSIDKGTLVILQTNDYYEIEDHINCVDNIDQFKEMAPMTDCMYDGVLNLDTYNRFMLIGYR